MNGLRHVYWLGLAVLLGGCLSPQYTRLPSLTYGSPEMERRSLSVHNPLPERESGRAIEAPRGFELERSEPRRTTERFVAPTGYAPDGSPGLSPSASRYPQSVTP
jgi:hypothetical protein